MSNWMARRVKREFGILEEASIGLDEVLPDRGFLRDFFQFTRELTDACSYFILFGGLVALSSIVSKRVSLEMGEGSIRPALWVLLLGESTRSRKSTVIRISRNLVYEVEKEVILPMEFSKEKLLELLSQRHAGSFFWPEGSNQLKYFKLKYMDGALELLTDLFDGGFYDRSIKSQDKPLILKNCPIGIFAGSQKDWWLSTIDEFAVRGGFFPRFLLVVSTEKGDPIPIPPKPDYVKRQALIDSLKDLCGVEGAVDIRDVEQKYRDWWHAHEEEIEKTSLFDDNVKPIIAAFYGRLSEYCWRLAILYQLSLNRSLTLSVEAMQLAINLIEFLKGNLKRMYLQGDFTLDKNMRVKQKLLQEIKIRPGIKHSELLRKSGTLAHQFRLLIDTLVQEGKVRREEDGEGRKKTILYCLEDGNYE